MNYWQIHMANRRRNRAQRDIFGLLENSHQKVRRQSKSKKTNSIKRTNIGLFSKAISFKVSMENALESRDEPSQDAEERIVVVPIDRIKRTIKGKTKGKKGSAVNNRGFDVVDLTDNKNSNQNSVTAQYIAKDLIEERIALKDNGTVETAPQSKSIINFQVLREKNHIGVSAEQTNQHIQGHKNGNFEEHDNINGPNGCQSLQDSAFIAQSIGMSQKSVTFDPLSEQKMSTCSVDFSKFENQIEANHCDTEFHGSSFKSFSNVKGFPEDNSGQSMQSGWSLNSSCFNEQSNSIPDSLTALKSIEKSNIATSTLSNMFDDSEHDSVTSVFSSRQSTTTHYDTRLYSTHTITHPNSCPLRSFSDSQETASENDWLSPFNSFFQKNVSMGKNREIKSQHQPQFTMGMVIQRKRLAAQRAYERLFGAKGTNQNKENEVRLVPGKTFIPISWFGGKTFRETFVR